MDRNPVATPVRSGLDRLMEESAWLDSLKGNVAYLCHAASVDRRLRHGIDLLHGRLGSRLKAVFSPQHGLYGEAQDDMIESDHAHHPEYGIPVYSLYSETRRPEPGMLEGIDLLVADLQEVGSRPYTYLSTLLLCMEACSEKDIEVLVLDRPNPVGLLSIEGNVLEADFSSFVGMLPIPMRHGCTIGELALFARHLCYPDCRLRVLPVGAYARWMHYGDTGLPWITPSPNMPSPLAALVFAGTVLIEGTNISEGRGTVLPFELIGHPALKAGRWLSDLNDETAAVGLAGFALRPQHFTPVFHKWAGRSCGGFQVHVTDRYTYRPWRTGQWLLREMYSELGSEFTWKEPPFEYEYERLPIDLLNGSAYPHRWVERYGALDDLAELEQEGMQEYLARREEVLLYR